jgi:ABC-2 type transport system ATP-binding protein
MSDNDIAISVSNVSKSFKIPHEQGNSLKSKLINFRKRGYEVQHALSDVSFDVKKGEFFGIVGRNGSGKSTLLKMLSGIYTPDSGSIEVNGKLTPFIELGVGFNPELSGRDNVFLNGALLGFTRKEMADMYDDIVEFAELERFMDQKLKNYSSGMQVRLAFSIAIRANTDILVLDEVLAVGDEAFQRKCNEYFAEVKRSDKTVVLVTHDMSAVRKYCDRAILIHDSEVTVSGSPEDVANEYSKENLAVNVSIGGEETEKNSIIQDLKVELISKGTINQDDNMEVRINYSVSTKVSTRIKLSLMDINRNAPLFATDSPLIKDNKVSAVLSAKFNSLNDTDVKMSVTIRDEEFEILDYLPDSLSPVFSLRRTDYPTMGKKTSWGLLFDRGDWVV